MSDRKLPHRGEAAPKRFQIDLHPDELVRMQSLLERCALTTKKDLFNNALVMFEWAVGEVEKGNKIASVNTEEKTFAELCMPPLGHAAKTAHSRIKGGARK